MRKLEKISVVLLALTALSALPGCLVVAAAAVGAAGAAYVNGDLEGRMEATPQRVVQASERALESMDIKVTSTEATGIDGRVTGRTALDKKIDITVKRDGDTASKVSIRVDTFGDEGLSRQIMKRIEEEL